jgi:hypothetical protein
MGPPALLPVRRKACCGFLSTLKSITSAGFEPAILGSSGKHNNHYTTEATHVHVAHHSMLTTFLCCHMYTLQSFA